MTIQQHASFDSSAAELNATSKLVKAWESKNAKNAAKAGGISMMALSLAACGGSSTTTTTTATTTTTTTVVTPSSQSLTSSLTDAYVGSVSDPDNQGVTISANQVTLDATDTIDAGSGVDTLAITNTAANSGIMPAQLNGVENIQMTSYGASSIDLLVATGVSKVVSKGSTAADTFSNVQSLASVEIDGSANATTVSYANSLVTATAEAAVEVKGGSTVSVLNIGAAGGGEFTVVNITSSGTTANTITLLEDAASSAVGDLVTVNVTGSADLTLGTGVTGFAGNNSAADMTLNAADATGDLTVTGTNFENITLGSGDDTLNLAATQVSAASAAADQVVLDGGEGANTLAFGAQDLSASGLANTSATTDNDSITNFQTLTFEVVKTDAGQATDVDRAVDANAISGVTTIYTDMQNLEASDSVDGDVGLTVSDIVAGQTIQVSSLASAGDNADEDLILDMDSPTGTTDAITLESVASAATTAHVNSLTSVTVNQTTVTTAQDVEILNLVATRADVSTAAGTQIQSLAAGDTTTLNITGAGGVTIDAIEMKDATTANTDVATINAADATGNVTIGKDGTSFQSTAADDFAITLGSGTNIVYAEATADDGDTITGTTGTDTVDLADSTGAVNLVNIDTVALSGSSTGTYTASAANWSGIGAVTVGMGAGSRTISNIDATLAGGKITVTDDIDSSDALTLTGATGVTAMEVTLSGTAISAGTLATNATDFTINVESHDSGATTAIDEKVVLNDTQTALTLTGGGVTSSAGTNASLNLDTGSSALIASINSTYDGSLDLGGVYFNTTDGATVTTGANTNAVTTTVLVADLTNSLVHFNDTAGIDTLTFTTTGADLGVINVDGYETIDVSSYNSGGTALAMNLRDSSGVETVLISGTGTNDLIDDISVLNASSALTFKVGGAYGDSSGADKILVTAAAGGSSDTITISSDGANFTSNHADSQMEVSGYETVTIAAGAEDIDLSPSSKEMTLTLTGATALNVGGDLVSASDDGDITLGTLAATSVTSLALTTVGGSVTIGALGTMNSLETFTITSGTGETATVTAGTSTSVDAITITGAGATTITALTAASLDTITASDATGAVTLGSASAAITSAAGATFTTGTGDDAITMSTAASRTLTAGEKTSDGDNLVLVGSMNSGAGVINLSSADQVVTINGSADALVQSEFEDVDVSAVTTNGSYSFTITANAAGSTIVGSGANDVINGGEGADTITGGAGNDTISIAETTNTSDVLKFAAADGLDTITGFTAGATAGDVIQSLVSLTDKNTSENAADATNATNQISASTDFVSETAEVAATDLAGTELVMVFDHVAVDSSIDFRSSTASEIATAIENALESTSSVFEDGNNAAIGAGNTGAVKLLVFKDAGTGAAEDAAVVLYQENTSSADADFATELTVLSVLQGVDTTALTIDNFFA